ncbi:hypothetical protein D3C84_653400 [compost metagenome]
MLLKIRLAPSSSLHPRNQWNLTKTPIDFTHITVSAINELVNVGVSGLLLRWYAVLQPLSTDLQPCAQGNHAVCLGHSIAIQPLADRLGALVHPDTFEVLIDIHTATPRTNTGIV